MRAIKSASFSIAFLLIGTPALTQDFWHIGPTENACQWQRDSLPQDQKNICLQRDRDAAATQLHPSKNLLAFERGDISFMKIFAQANAAAQCGLRSDEWLETFNTAYTMASAADLQTFHLTSAEIAAADAEGQKVYQDTISHIRCSDLTNSPTMDKLDKIQWKLTGGYH
jgi:hypothetical protein